MKLKYFGTYKGNKCYKCDNEKEYFEMKTAGEVYLLDNKVIINDEIIGYIDFKTMEVEELKLPIKLAKQQEEIKTSNEYNIFDLNSFVEENKKWIDDLLKIK